MLDSPFPAPADAVDEKLARFRRVTHDQVARLADQAEDFELVEAVCVLTRAAALARSELVRSSYVELFDNVALEVDGEKLSGLSLCGAARCCLVGSLYVAADTPMQLTGRSRSPALEGIEQEDRDAFLSRRPPLHLAYEALNLKAWELFEADPDLTIEHLLACWWHSFAEALFEGRGLSTDRAPQLFVDARELLLNELSQRSVRRHDVLPLNEIEARAIEAARQQVRSAEECY